MVLRKYQQEAIDNIDACVAFGSDKLIIDICTGGGKSLVISSLCNLFDDKTIIISTNITKLINQIASHLDEVGVSYSILKAGMESKFDSTARVQLVMEQTLHARDHIKLAADIVIRDEVHIGSSGNRYKQLISESGCELEIGFSATPYDSHGVSLKGYEVISCINTKKATDSGYLTPAKTYIAKFTKDIDFSDIGASGDYSANELDGVINNDEYNKAVVDAYNSLPKQPRRTIVFVSSIDHSDALCDMFNSNGIKAKSVHSKSAEEATFESSDAGLLDEQPSEECEVIVSVNKIAVGFDDTSINTCVICRPTKVRSLYFQMIGRSLRLHDGKDSVDILDCAKITAQHGFYDQEYNAPSDRIEAKKLNKSMELQIVDYALSQTGCSDTLLASLSDLKALEVSLYACDDLDALKARFKLCNDIEELLDLLVLIAAKVSTHKFSRKFVEQEVVSFVNEGGSFKAIKTRANNILKQDKKLNALKYFPAWIREQRWS